MAEFRIMPAQHLEQVTETCVRWGFYVHPHPNAGHIMGYLASWASLGLAEAAARILDVHPSHIKRLRTFVPEADGSAFGDAQWNK